MRRLIFCLFAVSMIGCATTTTTVAAGPGDSPAATDVNPFGKVFTGDGITVEMATLAAKNADGANDVIMRITGSEAFNDGINGKVIKYAARVAGAGGTGMDIVTQMNNADYVRMTLRNSSWELYVNSKSIRVSVDEEKSKQLDVKKLAAGLGK